MAGTIELMNKWNLDQFHCTGTKIETLRFICHFINGLFENQVLVNLLRLVMVSSYLVQGIND